MENEFGLEIGDDEWWRKAERRVLRDARRARRRARLKLVARWMPVVLVVAAVGAGGVWVVRNDRLPSMPTVDEPVQAVPAPLSEGEQLAPFLGTPAAQFADGADGIVLPAARPIGRYDAATVAAHLQAAKQVLVLSRLDPRMVERRDPSAFLALLAPAERARIAPRFAANVEGTISYATRLAPGQQQLAVPKVHGTMSVGIGRYGELDAVADYVFVYALHPAQPVYDRMHLHSVIRARVTLSRVDDRRYTDAEQGVRFGGSDSHYSSVNCAQAHKGLLAAPSFEGPSQPAEGEGPDSEKDYYRTDLPVPTIDSCGDAEPTASPTPTVVGRPV
jgi:hypothetical protein